MGKPKHLGSRGSAVVKLKLLGSMVFGLPSRAIGYHPKGELKTSLDARDKRTNMHGPYTPSVTMHPLRHAFNFYLLSLPRLALQQVKQ